MADFRYPRTTPPQSGLKTNPEWAARGVQWVVPQGGLCYTSDNRIVRPSSSAIKTVQAQHGLAVSDGGTRTTSSFQVVENTTPGTVWDKPSGAVTVFAWLKRLGNANGNAPIFGNMSPATSPYTAWGLGDGNGTGALEFQCSPGGVYTAIGTGAGFTGQLQFIVGVYDGVTAKLYIDGREVASVAKTGALVYPSDRGTALGNFYNYGGAARSFNGLVYLAGISPQALSAFEVYKLSRNPGQIFESEAADDWLPEAGGAFTPSIADTAAAADSASQVLSATPSVVEAASAADAVSSGVVNYAVSNTEAASASDTTGVVLGATPVVSESATALDTASAVAAHAVAVSEAASAADTSNGAAAGAYSASAVEAASASDTTAQQAAAVAVSSETAGASDSAASATGAFAALTEAASATDTSNGAAAGVYAASLAEPASAADSAFATAAVAALLSEAAGASDLLSAATSFASTVLEPTLALDAANASVGGALVQYPLAGIAATYPLAGAELIDYALD